MRAAAAPVLAPNSRREKIEQQRRKTTLVQRFGDCGIPWTEPA
jgi:hypothetical protein